MSVIAFSLVFVAMIGLMLLGLPIAVALSNQNWWWTAHPAAH